MNGFLRQLLPAWKEATFVVFICLLLIPSSFVVPGIDRVLMDTVVVDGKYQWIRPLMLVTLAVAVLTLVLSFLKTLAISDLQCRMGLMNVGRFFRRTLTRPATAFTASGTVRTTMCHDFVEQGARFLSERFLTNAVDLVGMAFFGGILFFYDVPLALFSILVVALTLFLIAWNQRRFAADSVRIVQAKERLSVTAVHLFSTIDDLRVADADGAAYAGWADEVIRMMQAGERRERAALKVTAILNGVRGVAGVLVFGFGAFRILSGELTPGGFLVFQMVLACFFEPAGRLASLGLEIQRMNANLARVEEPDDARPDDLGDSAAEGEGPRIRGRVEVRHAGFAYASGGDPALVDLSFVAEPGSYVALTGRSGCGKTTAARLLAGLLAPSAGEILFDGRPRRAIARRRLRRDVAWVDRTPSVFPGTVRENLTLFDPGIGEDALRRAAADAGIEKEILSLPDGYAADFRMAARGFSREAILRFEIARALASDPAVLILDGTTDAFDDAVAAEILGMLARRGVTAIVMSNRIATVGKADEVVVLDRGRTVERGRPEDLMSRNGPYARLAGEEGADVRS